MSEQPPIWTLVLAVSAAFVLWTAAMLQCSRLLERSPVSVKERLALSVLLHTGAIAVACFVGTALWGMAEALWAVACVLCPLG